MCLVMEIFSMMMMMMLMVIHHSSSSREDGGTLVDNGGGGGGGAPDDDGGGPNVVGCVGEGKDCFLCNHAQCQSTIKKHRQRQHCSDQQLEDDTGS